MEFISELFSVSVCKWGGQVISDHERTVKTSGGLGDTGEGLKWQWKLSAGTWHAVADAPGSLE